jgi:predicted AlkP superfamily pyrophosphatase or phosphodiesterase
MAAALLLGSVPASAAEPPKLILQITIDQLRGDMPLRFKDRFGEGGFRHLMDKGLHYTNAHYGHSTTFTAVGHATLYTGGYGAQHGLAGNDWHDGETGNRVYCVEDDQVTIIGKEHKAHTGTSPRNLTSSTVGDELVIATGGKSRAFAVSIKDRGAILPGGRLGKAFWYSNGSGQFVTSTYYYDDYPEWVKNWNATDHAGVYKDKEWTLLNDRSTYIYADMDDRPYEKSYKKLGRTFPHPLANEKASDFYGGLRYTPMGDEVTLNFTKELIKQEKVGQGAAIDFLSISFSATDYLGHAFGPNSLEAEDNLLHLDRTLADLFAFVDQTIGLDKTLIVLSSDHGIDAVPEYKKTLHFDAGRHYPKKFVEQVNEALKQRFKTDKALVVAFWNPSLYLDLELVKTLGLDVETVERALVEEILKVPGIALAMTRTDLLSGMITDTPITRKVQLAFHPKRSGNVLIVQDQFWYLYPNADQFAAMHGSPYSYDTYVPIMFAGPGIDPQEVSRAVGPEDIASTIAAFIGINPPSGSVGEPLGEVLPTVGANKKAATAQ